MSTSNAHPAQTGRNTAVLLVKLRRLVSRELGIALDLGDDNALRELHQQALRCRSEAVGELLKQLEAHLPKLEATPEPSTARASRAVYRGNALPTQPETEESEPNPASRGGGHYVTYRGQRYWRED